MPTEAAWRHFVPVYPVRLCHRDGAVLRHGRSVSRNYRLMRHDLTSLPRTELSRFCGCRRVSEKCLDEKRLRRHYRKGF